MAEFEEERKKISELPVVLALVHWDKIVNLFMWLINCTQLKFSNSFWYFKLYVMSRFQVNIVETKGKKKNLFDWHELN